MPFRNGPWLTALLVGIIGSLSSSASAIDDSPDGEALRLYTRANDYVSTIDENNYSYAYTQFYWKRAQSNIDRIERLYPETATGRKLVANELKLGPYDLTYFKERVLPRVEEKKVAAFDKVNCTIFLYNLDETRTDQARLNALQGILEVLARQKRWSEALAFPVLDEQRPLLLTSIFRIAARYNEKKVVDELITNATPAQQSLFWPIQGEALALTGAPRKNIAKFLDQHPQNEVKLAILSGMIDREVGIQRAATSAEPPKGSIPMVHFSLMNLEVRDNVDSVAQTFFPSALPQSENLLAKYRAALGEKPKPQAAPEVDLAYEEFLAYTGNFSGLLAYAQSDDPADDARQAVELKAIELFAQGGRRDDSTLLRKKYADSNVELGDAAALADFRGQMNSLEERLTVREQTFSALPIKDPCILSLAISDWSLTPNLSIRGAAPWDSVVRKYLPGFENLPLPKSKEVEDASSASKPF